MRYRMLRCHLNWRYRHTAAYGAVSVITLQLTFKNPQLSLRVEAASALLSHPKVD